MLSTLVSEPEFLTEHRFERALRGYLQAVADHLDIGLESCTLDLDTPASAYLALDVTLPRYPHRDLALLWDERHGWSAAVETSSREDLIILRYLGGPTVTPPPQAIQRFLAALPTGSPGQSGPPALRRPGHHDELTAELTAAHLG